MASLSSPTPPPPSHILSLPNKFHHPKRPFYPLHFHPNPNPRLSDSSSLLCRCNNNNNSSPSSFSSIQGAFSNPQLSRAVDTEDYEEAARIKVAITATAMKDTVRTVMLYFKKAVEEERYHDAAFFRDNAGAGLVGWWSGMSDDGNDPYGLIIRITAEYGRYLARSYSPRQLATSTAGVPLFEIFLKVNKKREFKLQAVYLKRKGIFPDPSSMPFKTFGPTKRMSPSVSTEDKNDLFVVSEDGDDENDTDNDSDLAEGLPGFKSILQDMIPGMKVKVLKITTPEKVDRDFIAKVVEEIMDEEDEEEEKDIDEEILSMEEEAKTESDHEKDETDLDSSRETEIIDNEEDQNEIAVKVVVGGLVQKLSGSLPIKETVRVPAKLDQMEKSSFSFCIEKEINQQDSSARDLASMDGKAKLQGPPRTADRIMLDLAKFVGREKIPLKVLKDIGELINLTLSQAQNLQPISGSTSFRRIEIATSPDPLSGLYIGTHGLYTSEVIQLRRKFGHWKEDKETKEPSNLEFYEYVEAIKLTGDPLIPAGQVAFRAKVGKRYQLPHKGIIPEEFGVVARYKGQGRLAEPGLKKPRWVDGELVILDGKFIKGGPVVGFVYWDPEYHFLVFFNRLKLQP
ncbi:hypothetical protein ACFE04_000353 [Oxalis oulophora]